MKKTFLPLLFICLTSWSLMAQISGQTSVATGSSYTYSYTSGGFVMSPQWRLDFGYGTITSQWQSGSTYYATIIWNTVGNETLAFLDGFSYLASTGISITLAPPPVPTSSPATSVTASSFTANWSYIASATNYRLDVSTNSSFTTFVGVYNNLSVPSNTQSVTGLIGGTTYYYRVRSQNAAGYSAYASMITVLTTPAAPSASSGTAMASSSFTANWSSVTGVTGYRIDVSTSSSFSSYVGTYNDLVLPVSTSLGIGGLTDGTTYYYRVRAVNSSGASINSNVITVQTLLATPSAYSATSITGSSFTANWSTMTNITNYLLDISESNSFSTYFSVYHDYSTTATSQSVTGLNAGKTYYYRIRTQNATGISAYSNTTTVIIIPPTPVASAGTAILPAGFMANWGVIENATSYSLDVAYDAGFTSIVPNWGGYSVTATSQNVTGLSVGTTYYYRVRAVNSAGTSGNSNTISVQTTVTAPIANAGSTITASSFIASWNTVSGATGYRLDVSVNSGFVPLLGSYSNLSVGGTSLTVSGLSPGTTYYYRVRAEKGSVTSPNSNSITVLTLPAPPTPGAASGFSTTSFTANWGSVISATSYQLDVSTVSNFASFVTGYNNLSVAGVSQSVSGLTAGTIYYYRVRAVNGSGASTNSTTITTITLPSAPTASAASAITATSFTANWGSVTSATSYQLDVSTVSNFASFVAGYNNLSVAGVSQSVSGLTAGTTYYYRVRAVNGSGASANSTTITTITKPLAPTASAASAIATTSFTANWGSVTSATSYQLDVSIVSNFASFVTGYNNLSVAGVSQSVSGLTAGTTYYYRVRAVNGSGASANSSAITTMTLPAAPAASAATAIATTSFTANWGSVTSATGYRLDVSTVNTFASFVIGYNNLTVTTTSQVVSGLAAATTYYYRVRAVNASGASSNSTVITVLTVPALAVATAGTSVTGTSFIANWGSVANATSYRLDVATSVDFSTLVSGYIDLSVTSTSKTVTGLTLKTTYYYRVRSCNTSCAQNSNIIAVDIPDRNYIVTTAIQKEGITTATQIGNATITEKTVTTNFFDGLGRPMQTVSMKGSPSGWDIVQPVVYDVYGRENKKYLPFTVANYNDGWYKPNEEIIDGVTGNYIGIAQPFYATTTDKVADDTRPYSETVFEPSPMSRPDKDFGAGSDWFTNNKNVKHGYLVNVHGTAVGEEKIIAWEISGNLPVRGTVLANYIETGGYYSSGALTIKSKKDEQGNEVREYTDKLGRIILKKVQAVASPSLSNRDHWAQTYYVYDGKNNLRFVFPPELTYLLYQNDTYNPVATDLDNWAFQYTYDLRNRMITKEVPGSGVVNMVYDNRDRLVLIQDAILRSVNKWTFIKYDVLNRPVLTGIYTDNTNTTLTAMQGAVNTYYNNLTAAQDWHETYTGSGIFGYNNYSFPQVTNSNEYLTVTYYDKYDFRGLWYGTYTYLNEGLSETANGITYSQPVVENTRLVGSVTGTMTKVLDGGTTGGYTWLKSVNYYDDKYRVIQTLADNYKGGTDRTTNVIDFAGKVLETKSTHSEADVSWKDLVGVLQAGNKLIKTSTGNTWGNSGAASVQQLPAGQNGWLEFTVSETTSNRMVGLSDVNTNANYNTIDYALYQSTTSFQVYENGTLKYTATGALTPGEVLRVERTGTTISYKRNGTALYTSAVASNTLLMADAALYTASATLVGVRASFGTTSRTVKRRMEYDHAGRLIKTWHQLDANAEILLAYIEYNELGQLVDKKLHSTVSNASDAKQSVDHRYNIRGWLTKINESDINVGYADASNAGEARDFFGMQLAYNNTDLGISNTAQYNGNISAIAWSNNLSLGTNKQNGFVYSYDPMSRLTLGTHKLSATALTWTAGQYEESITSYDLNGNIKALQRKGAGGVQIDNLTYNYGAGSTQSNKLLYVQDNTANATDKAKGFVDGNTGTTTDYTYDVNGNMTRDLNKGIGTSTSDATNIITYNFLNLPETVTKGANSIRYIYDAGGQKLAQVTTFGTQQKTVDYAGPFQYENDVLQFINHEEGRIAIAGTKSIYLHEGDALTGIATATSTLATVTLANGEKYVSATSVGTTTKQGMFPIGGTFSVQAGEQYRIRAKGYSTGANTLYLYIRTNSTDLNWPGASLPSGTTAEASAEQIITIPTGHTTLQAGVVWNTVTAGQQFFLNDFEITKLTTNTTPEYQYNLKDHLGNVRLTFTSKDEVEVNTATMETANANTEQSQFINYNEAIIVNTSIFDHTNVGPTYYSTRLTGGATNAIQGLAKSLSVMPGDKIDIEVFAKYLDPNSANWTAALTSFMAAIAGGTAPAGTVIDGGQAGSMGGGTFPFTGFLSHTGETGSNPKAYLNYLVFDRNYVFKTGGFRRISTAARETGTDILHERLAFDGASQLLINEPGYVYIWLSNENTTTVEVYFDDFKITHTKSPVIQQDDYFPFGLTFNSYSKENSFTNRWKFQGQEHVDDLGLNWDSFKWRNHQPDIGRFFNIDPLSEKYVYNSPYAFAENRVVDGRELEGLEWMPVNSQGNQVTPTSNQIASYNWVGYTNVTTPTGAPYASSTPETIFSYAPVGTVSEGAVIGTQNGTEGANFYSVDANQQGVTEFSTLSCASISFNGSMNGNTAEGTLRLTNSYENGKAINVTSQSANSGPWGNGALPNGDYSADQVVSPTYNTGMVVGTNDFAIHLSPNFQTNRDGLYVHPDGGSYVGTRGCIGLTGTANQMQSLRNNIQTRMTTQATIPLNVNITGNPNNQGGNNNNPNVRE